MSIRNQFVVDLLRNLHCAGHVSADTELGAGLSVGDILVNQEPEAELHFAGVYLQFQPDGQVLFKAMKGKSADTPKVLSKTFSVSKHGVRAAFLSAVKQRANYCSYTGSLPLERLVAPSYEQLLSYAVGAKGYEWVDQNNIAELFKRNL